MSIIQKYKEFLKKHLSEQRARVDAVSASSSGQASRIRSGQEAGRFVSAKGLSRRVRSRR